MGGARHLLPHSAHKLSACHFLNLPLPSRCSHNPPFTYGKELAHWGKRGKAVARSATLVFIARKIWDSTSCVLLPSLPLILSTVLVNKPVPLKMSGLLPVPWTPT